MVITVILIGVLMLCIGFMIGMFVELRIDKDYYLKMMDIVKESLGKHNEIYAKYYQENNKSNMEFLDKVIDMISDNQKFLAESMDEINKSCYVPIWKDVDKELPECKGIYYGKKDDTDSMWKVVFKNNEWYLSGCPEHKIDVIKWTELY